MVSQFISPDKVNLLGDINYTFPAGTHAIGRLDNFSEGLLILTTNKQVTKLLFESKIPHKRKYIIQVLHHVTDDTIQHLRDGVSIKIKGNLDWITTACEVTRSEKPKQLNQLKNQLPDFVPHTWLEITLTEGKFHQVRKMVFALRHKCKRLIRVSIENLLLGDLQPGCVKEIEEKEFFEKLKIDYFKN